jgi:hypothetical protein
MDIPRTFSEAFKGQRANRLEVLDISHGLLNILLDLDVITRAQKQDCEAPSTEHERASKLLDILERRPDSLFQTFCHGLGENGQQHVGEILLSGGGRSSNSISYNRQMVPARQMRPPPQYSSGGYNQFAGRGGYAPNAMVQYAQYNNPVGNYNAADAMAVQPYYGSGGTSAALTRLRTEFLPADVNIIHYNSLSNLREIAEGGFGIIHEAVHADWGTVAYKKLKATVINPNERMARELQREAQAHVLRHQNIVAVLGVVFEQQQYGIVMEYAAYGGLDEFVQKYSVDVVMKLSLAGGVVNGMNYLHTKEQPVIHGDLKTQNVLIADGYVPKICDFGLSKWKQYSTIKTNSRSMRGTVTHIPPETWADINCRRTSKYDVYSFGVLLYELLTEKLAFDQAMTEQIRLAVLAGNRPNLTYIDDIVRDRPELAAIAMVDGIKGTINRLWTQKQEDRPEFAELMKDFDIFARENEVEIRTAKANLDAEVMQASRP